MLNLIMIFMRKSGRSFFRHRTGFVHFLPNFYPSPSPPTPLPTEPSPGGRERGKGLAYYWNELSCSNTQTHSPIPVLPFIKRSIQTGEGRVFPGPPTLLDFHFPPETPVEPFFDPCCLLSHREIHKLN